MALLDDLIAARDGAVAKLKEAMTVTGAAGGIPNADASGVDHGEYVRRLRETITDLNEQISTAGGPWEEITGFWPG
jgi:hypothetical protein